MASDGGSHRFESYSAHHLFRDLQAGVLLSWVHLGPAGRDASEKASPARYCDLHGKGSTMAVFWNREKDSGLFSPDGPHDDQRQKWWKDSKSQ
jgi:hypothetical protein